MAKGKLIEQLNDAVEALVAKPNASQPNLDPRLGAILRIAGELRDLPRADFRSRLKAELAAQSKEVESSASSPSGGKPLITHQDIEERLKQIAEQPKFIVHDVNAALSDLPGMTMRFLDAMNDHLLVVSRGSQRSKWERHLGSDEMIYVTEGKTEVETLTEDGPVKATVRAGSLFVCPEGLWHRLTPQPSVSAFYLTPRNTEGSAAKDPRSKKERVKRGRKGARSRDAAMLREHELQAALREVVITYGRPFLGICVGMQLMADRGREFETVEGLGWIGGEVVAIVCWLLICQLTTTGEACGVPPSIETCKPAGTVRM